MKPNISAWLLCAVTLWSVATCRAQTAERVGTFKVVEGQVTAGIGLAQQRAIVGHAVHAGDRIVSAAKSMAVLSLRDGTQMSVGADSTVDLPIANFDTTARDGQLSMSLVQGQLRVITGWLAKVRPEQVKVITPTSVVGVRGTDFVVEVP